MSKRHRRTMLRVFREMAENGHDSVKLKRTHAKRWRPIVRLIAKQRDWRFVNAFLWSRFRGAERLQVLAMAHQRWAK